MPPRNDIETTIADIWQAILGIAPIGIYDRFFELGGHSLLAIQPDLADARGVSRGTLRTAPVRGAHHRGARGDHRRRQRHAARLEEAARSEEMLRMVEQLSEDEVAALLASRTARRMRKVP